MIRAHSERRAELAPFAFAAFLISVRGHERLAFFKTRASIHRTARWADLADEADRALRDAIASGMFLKDRLAFEAIHERSQALRALANEKLDRAISSLEESREKPRSSRVRYGSQ
jgi:hypothetical protein